MNTFTSDIDESFNESLSLEEHGEQLIQLALNHDSKDNISVLIKS
jgi:serine/threonine protein phosphatase PrpC